MVCGQICAHCIIFNAIKFPTRQNTHINATSIFKIAVYTLWLRLLQKMNSSDTHTHAYFNVTTYAQCVRVCLLRKITFMTYDVGWIKISNVIFQRKAIIVGCTLK